MAEQFAGYRYRAFRFAVVDGFAFYRVEHGASLCFGAGDASRPGDLGSLGCRPVGAGLRAAVEDMSSIVLSPQHPQPRLLRVVGIAGDGVVAVRLLDAQGRVVASTRVGAMRTRFPRRRRTRPSSSPS